VDIVTGSAGEARPEDDVRLGVGARADHLGGGADLTKPQVRGSGDFEQDPARALDARLEQRAPDRPTRRVERSRLAVAATQSDERRPGAIDDGANVREVEVDQARVVEQVDDAPHRLEEHVVDGPERVEHRGVVGDDVGHPVVGDRDDGIGAGRELGHRHLGVPPTLDPLEGEWHRHDRDRQRAMESRIGGDDRGGA
jgi:hypothetical protein